MGRRVSKAAGDRPWMCDTQGWDGVGEMSDGGRVGREEERKKKKGKKAHQYLCLSESLRLFNEISLPYLPLPRSG